MACARRLSLIFQQAHNSASRLKSSAQSEKGLAHLAQDMRHCKEQAVRRIRRCAPPAQRKARSTSLARPQRCLPHIPSHPTPLASSPQLSAMSWLLQALAEWLGFEPSPVPGTPEHREALCRVVKQVNDERAKPPGQRDEARLLELTKRRLRLTIPALQVVVAAGSPRGPGPPGPEWRQCACRRPTPRRRAAAAACAGCDPYPSDGASAPCRPRSR